MNAKHEKVWEKSEIVGKQKHPKKAYLVDCATRMKRLYEYLYLRSLIPLQKLVKKYYKKFIFN